MDYYSTRVSQKKLETIKKNKGNERINKERFTLSFKIISKHFIKLREFFVKQN